MKETNRTKTAAGSQPGASDADARPPELFAWNDTATPLPARCIHEEFERQAETNPGARAVVCGERYLTYGELNIRANRLAQHLRARGVSTETIVGLCVERSIEMIVGLLGILKAGGAYLPLDPSYPFERLAWMIQDSGVRILVSTQASRASLPPHDAFEILLDADWPAVELANSDNPSVRMSPENLAYCAYTSGSTGKPKGVLCLHIGALNRFQWMWDAYGFTPEDVCCQKTSLSFVDSVWEIFGPLLRGVPLILIPDPVLSNLTALVELLATHRVTRIVLVPSFLNLLFDLQDDLHERLPHLKYWFTSGEELTLPLCERFQTLLPGRHLINLYGSSEISADATFFDVAQQPPDRRVLIGRPISNMSIYLLDENLQPVAVGETGELYAGGAGLARGYLNRPAMTAQRFIPNPFDSAPGTRLYRTGDLARYLPDGRLEFLGRADRQVKIRGQRVEPGEVEAALRLHASIRDAAVLAKADVSDGQRLIAYLIPPPGVKPPDSSVLRRHLLGLLPEYMVPTAFVAVSAWPLTPNGKIDRAALADGHGGSE